MSQVYPYGQSIFAPSETGENQANPVCPRYEKWMQRITNIDNEAKHKHKPVAVSPLSPPLPPPSSSSSSFDVNTRRSRSNFQFKSLFRRRSKSQVVSATTTTDDDYSYCDEPTVTKKTIVHNGNGLVHVQRDRPRRTKTIFLKIRNKSKNFGIRCRTSVELWRKWITKGIQAHLTAAEPTNSHANQLTKADIDAVSCGQFQPTNFQ